MIFEERESDRCRRSKKGLPDVCIYKAYDESPWAKVFDNETDKKTLSGIGGSEDEDFPLLPG
jgi:hypothetical protein